jgi:ribosome-associated protein YbcJ (S4-like RNA binding protein)
LNISANTYESILETTIIINNNVRSRKKKKINDNENLAGSKR